MSSELRALWENAGGKCPADAEIVSFDSLLKDSKSLAVGVMYPGEHTLGGIPLIKVGDISGGRVIFKPSYLISDEVNKEYVRTQLKGDELLVTLVGNPGECVVVNPEMAGWNAARAIAVAKFKDPSLRTYVKAVLESYAGKHLIDSVLNTTVQKTLNLKDLKKLPIPLPNKDKVLQISDFVNCIDDRITLLRETNTTLEAIAQALFKSWFVDFAPVHAKQQCRAPESMDAQTAALFPDAFEESELGMVPKGWRVGTIGATCTLGRGASPRPIQNFMDGEIPWIKIADATASDGLFIFETVEKVTEAGAQKSVFVCPGDLILSNSASCGIPTFVDIHGCIHDGWLYFRDFSLTEKYFLFFWLKKISQHLINIADGSVQKNLNTKLVSSQPILIPPENIRKYFESFIESFFVAVKENCKRSMRLVELRDTLLPRLISGQLRLPEAQALVEDAVDD